MSHLFTHTQTEKTLGFQWASKGSATLHQTEEQKEFLETLEMDEEVEGGEALGVFTVWELRKHFQGLCEADTEQLKEAWDGWDGSDCTQTFTVVTDKGELKEVKAKFG